MRGPMQFDTLVDGGSHNYILAQTTIQLQTTGNIREDASDNDGNITLRGEDNSSVTITTNNPSNFTLSASTHDLITFDDKDKWELTTNSGTFELEDPNNQLNIISNTGSFIKFSAVTPDPEGWTIRLNGTTELIIASTGPSGAFAADINVAIEVPESCPDTDGDSIPDSLDTDADGDGCSDAVEAGFTDADENGQVDGTGIDADGLVTGGDGYTVPADTDSSGTADHLEVSVVNCGVSNPNCPVSTGGIMLLPQEVGATISPLNLEEKFLDADGDELTYDISNSNPTIATLTITDDTLVVYDFLTPGTTEVTITASDGFCSESVSFTIDVYLDTDVDAINDDVDLDDDNDGILDVDEGCYYGALEFDGNQVLWNQAEYSNCPGRPYH